MEETNEAFKKNPIAWTIFICYCTGWILPVVIEIFFSVPLNHLDQKHNRHSPFTGFLILSFLYLLIMLILGFIFKKNNIYLKLSGYIGISLIIFTAVYSD
ncbi:hypothetical protein [Pedobacter sp. UBA5917]|jgi:uncharacterized membrane protein|uniref:hypothetical protein n=1 Tax=Pedobacter sp. UBA5917 TaxID=1947061 RepID=UPI0025FDC734|nr:hypothetical protein [Pedobacter sp. UBA5917]